MRKALLLMRKANPLSPFHWNYINTFPKKMYKRREASSFTACEPMAWRAPKWYWVLYITTQLRKIPPWKTLISLMRLISLFLWMNPLQIPEIGISTFSQVNPTLEWPHKAVNKPDLQQQALAQAPGEGFSRHVVGSSWLRISWMGEMGGVDVFSLHWKIKSSSYRLKNLLRVAVSRSLMPHLSLDFHILWAWFPALRAGKCLFGCQVDNPSSQSLHLFGDVSGLAGCVFNYC